MYKVLLADDEILDLEGMKQFIPWSELNMEIVGSVTNGFSACELMDLEEIDILVTDVNMPNMSGLELARNALDKKQDIRIIFVSGYQDFHYVRQALSLKAVSYVLKPMDDSELIASLKKIREDLDAERTRRATEETYQHMLPMAKNDFMIRLLEGDLSWSSEDGLQKLGASYGVDSWNWPLHIAVMELDDRGWNTEEAEPMASQELFRAFWREMLKLREQYHLPHISKLPSQRIALFIQPEWIQACISHMREVVKERFHRTMTVGVGMAAADVDQLTISYQQSLQAIEGKMFFGKGSLIWYTEDDHNPGMIDVGILDVRLDALFKAMTQYELVQIHDEIEKVFQSVSDFRSKYTIHNLAMYMVWKLDQYLRTLNESLFDMLGLELHNLNILLQFDTIRDIRSWFVMKVYEISEQLRHKSNSKNNKLIQDMMKTMKERMSENLTLKDIAVQYSFSPNYLGFMFKEEVGKTFSEVLIQLRMQRARELIKDPTMKIYEVADQVGYRYLPYFSRQFKETFGMTPMEMRKRE